MQKMICIPVEQYDRMVESYDKAMEEIGGLREQLKVAEVFRIDVDQQLKLYDLMDMHNCDMDTAELLLRDQKEGERPGSEN